MTPEEGWEEAHYPAPNGVGTSTIWLTHEHHQIQGLLQSEEYGRCCFFIGDAKKFLSCGPFVTGWFKLWGLYDNWAGDSLKKLLSEKDESGRSVRSMEQLDRLNAEKDETGKSVNAVKNAKKLHFSKDERGRSIAALKGAETTNSGKDKLGRSINGVESAKRLHAEKDESGRSIAAVKGGERGGRTTGGQKWKCTVTGFISSPGPLSMYQKARGIDTKNRVKVS